MKHFIITLASVILVGQLAQANCTDAYANVLKDSRIGEVLAGGTVMAAGLLVGGGLIAGSGPVGATLAGGAITTAAGFATTQGIQNQQAKKMIRLLAQSSEAVQIVIELTDFSQKIGTDLKTGAEIVRTLDEQNAFCSSQLLSFDQAIELVRNEQLKR